MSPTATRRFINRNPKPSVTKSQARGADDGLRVQSKKAKAGRTASRTPALFDWSQIAKGENHRQFELMALDIVAYELDFTLFTPNVSRIGKDGGADGLYSGKISGVPGPWKIACATRSTRAKLKAKIWKENKNATKLDFQGLLFITPFPLTPVEVKNLLPIAGKGLQRAIIWPRGKLDQLLRKHPWIATQYLGHQIIPGFVPLAGSEREEPSGQSDIPLVGREDECSKVRDFLCSAYRIMVLVAPGGSGKSRLLREAFFIAHQVRPRRSAWLRRPGQDTVERAVRSGLVLAAPTLVCLDDAGLALGEVAELSRLATDRRPGVDAKLILAVREVDRDTVLNALAGAQRDSQVVELREMDESARIAIAERDCPPLSRRGAQKLVKVFGRNLFLLRAAAFLIRDGHSPRDLVTVQHLSNMVAERLLAEAKKLVPSDETATESLLLRLAIDVPVHASEMTTSQAVATLKEAGILRPVGNTLRFRSDVEGDVVLGYLLRKPWARANVHSLLSKEPNRMMARVRNLAAAGAGHPAEILRHLCLEWSRRFDTISPYERANVAALLPHCVPACHTEVVLLTEQLAKTHDISTDELGPIVLAISRHRGPAEGLASARQLDYQAAKKGSYANYTIEKLGAGIVDLRNTRPDGVSAVCGLIEGWISQAHVAEDACALAPLIQSSVAPMLQMTVQFEEAEGDKITFGEQPLLPTPQVLEMRSRALSVVQTLLQHPLERLRLAGAHLVDELVHGGGVMTTPEALLPTLEREIEHLAPTMTSILTSVADHEVHHLIEKALFFVWASQGPGNALAGALLQNSNSSPTYKAYTFVSEPWEWVDDLQTILARAPARDRWKWWNERRPSDSTPYLQSLLVDLVLQCATPGALLQFVEVLPTSGPVFSVLNPLCERIPEIFAQAALLVPAGPAQGLIARAAARRRRRLEPGLFITDLKAALSVDDQVVHDLIQEAQGLPVGLTLDIARLLVEQDSVTLRARGISLIGHRRDIDAATLAGLVIRALRSGQWSAAYETVWSAVHRLTSPPANWVGMPLTPELANLIGARLAETGRSGQWDATGEWYAQHLLELMLVGDDPIQDRIRYIARMLPAEKYERQRFVQWCMTPLLKSEIGFRSLAASGCNWVRSKGLPDIRTLVVHIEAALGREQVPQHMRQLSTALLSSQAIEERELGLRLLSIDADAQTCALVADTASRPGPLRNVAEQLVAGFSHPRRGSSHKIGEAAPAMVSLRATLEAAKGKVTVSGAEELLRTQQQIIDGATGHALRSDAELLDPR